MTWLGKVKSWVSMEEAFSVNRGDAINITRFHALIDALSQFLVDVLLSSPVFH